MSLRRPRHGIYRESPGFARSRADAFAAAESHQTWECGIRFASAGDQPKPRFDRCSGPGDTPGWPAGRTERTAMDAVVKPWPKPSPEKPTLSEHVRAAPAPVVPQPSREEALSAVRPL